VLALRLRRLDQEDLLVELSKSIDEQEKLLNRLTSKEKSAEKDLLQTELEIRKFQTAKQRALDLLEESLPLKLSQLCCFEPIEDAASDAHADEDGVEGSIDGSTLAGEKEANQPASSYLALLTSPKKAVELPIPTKLVVDAPLASHALFPLGALERLARRIKELGDEAALERSSLASLHREKKALEKEELEKKAALAAAEAKNEGIQMLRFGQVLDMRLVEEGDVGVAKEAENTARLRSAEAEADRALALLVKQEQALKQDLIAVTQTNTQLLASVAELTSRQFFLEKELNGPGAQAPQDSGALKREIEERDKLVALVKLQAKEVEALKTEVALLRRKGGHIYVPGGLPQPP